MAHPVNGSKQSTVKSGPKIGVTIMATDWTYDGWDHLDNIQIKRYNESAKTDGWVKFHGMSYTKRIDSSVFLMSYDTVICEWDTLADNLYIRADAFEFSRTTCNHINRFLRDVMLFPCYQAVKSAKDFDVLVSGDRCIMVGKFNKI